jgi:hypothetical protein
MATSDVGVMPDTLERTPPRKRTRLRKPSTRGSRARLRFLPVTTRDSSTVNMIDPADARVVGFLAFDGFF